MIFVTVGTHEQPFERLMNLAATLAACGQEVVVQYGACAGVPPGCSGASHYPYEEMQRLVATAKAVVTHGGTGSIMLCLESGRRPLVVPRLRRFGEHVDDHQLQIVEALAAEGLVSPVYPETPPEHVLELLAATALLPPRPPGGTLGVFLAGYLDALERT
jgi:UDP-N-acetylglucosamine transferase subunit ALG13